MAAEVRYCVPVGKKFHAGVEIQNSFSSVGEKSRTPPGDDSKITVHSDPQAVQLRADSYEEYTMEDRETGPEWAYIVGVIASLLVLTFAAYLGFFLREWDLAFMVIVLATVLGAAILVIGFLD